MKVQKNKYKRALQIMSLCEKHLNKSIDCYNMAVDYSGEVTVMGYFNNEVARRLIQLNFRYLLDSNGYTRFTRGALKVILT